MSTPPPTIEHGPLVGYLRPPQTNGAEHYDVAFHGIMAGRVTRRAAPHNERPTPGWYVWNAWESSVGGGYLLRDAGNNVIYYPTPEQALADLFEAMFPDSTRPDPLNPMTPARPARGCNCACSTGGFCGGCGHAGCGGRR